MMLTQPNIGTESRFIFSSGSLDKRLYLYDNNDSQVVNKND